jgi:hypothetical protein
MSKNNWVKVSGRAREVGEKVVEKYEPHHEDPHYIEGLDNDEMFTPYCFGCANNLDKAHYHTHLCNAKRGLLSVFHYHKVLEIINEEDNNGSDAGLAKKHRRKSLRRKSLRRKSLRRKSLRRKSLRRKSSRRKSLRRK